MSLSNSFASWSPRLLSVLRIIAGFMFIQHGSMKLFNFPAAPMQIPLLSMAGIGGIIEFIGGILLILGLFTRPAAFILSGEMAVAYFGYHASRAFSPVVNQGELAVVFCFLFLYMSAAGGGAWSLDRLLRRPRD